MLITFIIIVCHRKISLNKSKRENYLIGIRIRKNNYSNIELPGYMYNLRKVSMSRGDGGIELKKIRAINYLLYFKIFYKYIEVFKKSRKGLYYEMKNLKRFI